MTQVTRQKSIRLHLTNVTGKGATELLSSLLPAICQNKTVLISEIYLPDSGPLSNFEGQHVTLTTIYRRYLPRKISRLLECVFHSSRFSGTSPLIVLGDIPLRTRANQTVFLQQALFLMPNPTGWHSEFIRVTIARLVFWFNQQYVDAIVVQTEVMRDALEAKFPKTRGKTHVVRQPAPIWLLEKVKRRFSRAKPGDQKLALFYPARDYPHKNHSLLFGVHPRVSEIVDSIAVTIEPPTGRENKNKLIKYLGLIDSTTMVANYESADALLFLSKIESYGLPLVEAMFVGLPVVCPNLPYARILCGPEAIYFDAESPSSLFEAIVELDKKLKTGWWPNWEAQLLKLPANWDAVASQLIEIATKKFDHSEAKI